uniref:Uncharacterized protein n=1 Tax=Mesocestoides corti TaxID=53468 RepID=A0A5K3FLT6_MESCO
MVIGGTPTNHPSKMHPRNRHHHHHHLRMRLNETRPQAKPICRFLEGTTETTGDGCREEWCEYSNSAARHRGIRVSCPSDTPPPTCPHNFLVQSRQRSKRSFKEKWLP